ncbi:MAG: DUF4011 domain-containing protein [Pseudomonadota bacterium]
MPILRSLTIENPGPDTVEELSLRVVAHPCFCREKRWTIDRITGEGSVAIADRDLVLDLARLGGLDEAESGQLTFTLCHGDDVLTEEVVDIRLIAKDEWGGLGEMAQILAAFVSPNDPAVARILKEAGRILERHGHSPSLDGYQSGDPRRTYMLSAAIWSAVTGLGLTYAEPPKSFEREGQKVRMPRRIEEEGLATCLDTALFLAAALEAAGLNPVVVFTRGHAFTGVWLTDRTLGRAVEPDVTELRKAIAAQEFVAFETTLTTRRPPAGFDEAVREGARQLSEEVEDRFDRAVDLTRSRKAGIKPLASHAAPETRTGDADDSVAPAALPGVPDFGLLTSELVDEAPKTPDDRIARWQRKLLDLSLRNRLLNFADTKSAVPFVCGDVPGLEDSLADGVAFRIISLVDENPIGERDADLHRQRSGEDIHAAFAASAQERRQICVPLDGRDMTRRLIALDRKARSDMSEGGTNTLFLAAGFLRWKKSAEDKRTYRAPLVLIPVKLKRQSAQSDFRLSHHEDEVRFNATLLQFLARLWSARPGARWRVADGSCRSRPAPHLRDHASRRARRAGLRGGRRSGALHLLLRQVPHVEGSRRHD